jgi:hypothetical protein
MLATALVAAFRRFRHSLAAVAIAAIASSCGPGYQAPQVTPQLVKLSSSTSTRLERGYVVHEAKCAKCHPFEDPAKYSVADLEFDIMPSMARKSKIDHADEKAVLEYLLAARKLPPPVDSTASQ